MFLKDWENWMDWGNNPRKRRDRLYIMAEILNVAKEGVLKTQIMYKANLSFAQLNDYLTLLLELKLLKAITNNKKTTYKTTKKGTKFLENYKEIVHLLRKDNENYVRNRSTSACKNNSKSKPVFSVSSFMVSPSLTELSLQSHHRFSQSFLHQFLHSETLFRR